ncbi:MAG: ABC transporter permease [Muribaculaceae bacterium]|nr:ABC transporter permease [Muribaculaceae bacterium]
MKREKRIGISTLLKKNISKGQLIGFSVANLIGLTVILCGILFYSDSHHRKATDDKFFSDDYIVVSKEVKGINLDPVAFNESEIADLASQPWVKKLGKFTSADFRVNASIEMGGRGMSTYLFFESVPDEFFDSAPAEWKFDPDKRFVPVVLNKDYLALYNFGFAIPRGMPQLSEEMIGSVPLKILITGDNGRSEVFNAAVVGFSSRLNTIAVPQDFMDWANQRFSRQQDKDVSRLILKIDRLNSTDWEKYLRDHGMELAGDKEGDSKVSQFMGLVSGVVAATGFVISVLALFILILSIFLLIQKSRPMLRNLILLGYSPSEVIKFYAVTILIINIVVTLLAVGFTFICRLIWHDSLISLGLGNGNVLFTLGAALLYLLLLSLINITVIRRHVYRIWQSD